nr:hypothetical protein [Tanacetum cinerariifolium]
MYYLRFTKVIIDYFMTRKPSISRENRINWYYVRDDVLFSTTKVVSRHQTTQQYVVSALRLSVTVKGKQPARAITPTEPTDVQRTEAEQLNIALKRSRQETYISQQRAGSESDKDDDGNDDEEEPAKNGDEDTE